jgi:diacylglycerol O-acyltransferase
MSARHLDRLTSFDASFLVNEKAHAHMAIGAVLVCDGQAPTEEVGVERIMSRLHLLPRLRHRLAFPPRGTPFWIDHPQFDLKDHMRRVRLPAPGSDEQFRETVGEILTPPLDRSRPLWELWVVEGLADDRFALIYKTHHAMADGISAVDIGVLLADFEDPDLSLLQQQPWQPQPEPSPADFSFRKRKSIEEIVIRVLCWLQNAGTAPSRAWRRFRLGMAGLKEVALALAKPAPTTPFNVAIGPQRALHWTTCGLSDFRQICQAFGGTVNDVSLAVTAGALRRWLLERNVEVSSLEMQALVPVSIREDSEHGRLGNRLTAMRGPLPVHLEDPVARLRYVSAAMRALKSSKQPYGAMAVWGLNDLFRDFAPVLLSPTSSLNFSTRLFNMLVTNVPGPETPVHVLGHEVLRAYPVGFLAEDHALAVTMVSYNGAINFGLLSDPGAISGIEELTTHITDEVASLLSRTARAPHP